MTLWVESSINDYWVNIDKIDFITIAFEHSDNSYQVLASVQGERIPIGNAESRKEAVEFVQEFLHRLEMKEAVQARCCSESKT